MATIQRLPADKPANEEIVSSLLKTDAAQIERGRQEINYSSTDRVIRTCLIASDDFIQPGELISIQDISGMKLGMLTDFSVSMKEGFTSSEIVVECLS